MRYLVHYITYPLTMPLGRESHIKIKGSDIKREVILKSMESNKKTTMLSEEFTTCIPCHNYG